MRKPERHRHATPGHDPGSVVAWPLLALALPVVWRFTLAANDAATVTFVRVNKNGNNTQLAQRLTVPCLELMQTIDRIIEKD
jgi:hypothetical protein